METRTRKFCKFCAEPHKRIETTCSEECSSELIRTEFQENGDPERSCLWCPVRGDLASFKHQNICSCCYSHRRRLGACSICGGPNGPGKICHRCTDPAVILEKNKTLRAFILFDIETGRARRVFSKGGYIQTPREFAGIIEVSRHRFERPKVATWTDPTTLVRTGALTGPAISSRIEKLNLFLRAGQGFTANKWVRLYSDEVGTEHDAGMRHFERSKTLLRSWGVNVKTTRSSKWSLYEFDLPAVEALHTYYKTILKNKQMGYYW